MSRVHHHLFWRCLYGLLATRAAVRAVAGVLRLVRRLRGEVAVARLLSEASAAFAWSGWPHHQPGWVNLDAARFLARVRRELTEPPPLHVTRRRPSRDEGPLRVGCLGEFPGLLTLAKEHFQAAPPPDVEVTALDLGFEGRYATYLEDVVSSYQPLEPEASPATIAAAANAFRLDVLLVVSSRTELGQVLDLVDTPCVMQACTGSDLLHHERVDLHLYPQPQADYFPVGERLFCGTSRSWFSSPTVVPAFFLYDRRDLEPDDRVPWDRREPLILYHGSLFKAVSPSFLETIFDLMRQDDGLAFVLMGRDDHGAMDAIRDEARRNGIADRLHYEGSFRFVRGPDGLVEAPGWETLRGYLERARLAPDPWPLGGGASRLEAYAAGAPSVHLQVRFDPASWGRPQHSLVEIEALRVEAGTVSSPEAYGELCRRCLYDGPFAEELVSEQARVCERVTNAGAYWQQLVDAHRCWREGKSRQRYPVAG